MPKPDQDLFCILIQLSHQFHLITPFFDILLVDADLIRPELTGSILISETLQRRRETGSKLKYLTVEDDCVGSGWFAPDIGNGFVVLRFQELEKR